MGDNSILHRQAEEPTSTSDEERTSSRMRELTLSVQDGAVRLHSQGWCWFGRRKAQLKFFVPPTDLEECLDTLKPIGLNVLLNTHCVMPDHGHEWMDHLAGQIGHPILCHFPHLTQPLNSFGCA